MSSKYLTKEGDTVDYVAWKFYGRQDNRIVERVLDANFGLAEHGPILPVGLTITLPDVDTQSDASSAGVKLWD